MNRHRVIRLLAPISLSAAAFGTVHGAEPSVPMSALKKCAAIDVIAERVSCYDRLAERPAELQRPTASVPTTTAPAAPKESFGLYSAEHPAAPPVKVTAITAKVVSIGIGTSGHPVVTLEGDQVWEMDAGDPVLKSGDTVKIDRAALGSFIMTTPSGRIHRLHRLH
jgi:hypothetical protein